MTKYKSRVHYGVAVEGLWWCAKAKAWVTLDDPRTHGVGCTNSRLFRTKRRAFGHAQFIGDVHFIGFIELCRLYGLDPKECVNADGHTQGLNLEGLRHLYPRDDGNYRKKEKSYV